MNETIVKLTCGYDYSMLLTASGKLYGFGMASQFQFGESTQLKELGMVEFFCDKQVVDVAICFETTLVLTSTFVVGL